MTEQRWCDGKGSLDVVAPTHENKVRFLCAHWTTQTLAQHTGAWVMVCFCFCPVRQQDVLL